MELQFMEPKRATNEPKTLAEEKRTSSFLDQTANERVTSGRQVVADLIASELPWVLLVFSEGNCLDYRNKSHSELLSNSQ